MTNNAKLYVVRIPGSEEIYAAPSHKVAGLMKASHDAWVTGWLAEQHAKGQALYMTVEDSLAVVEESEYPEDHADMLQDFSYSNWGITEADLAAPEDDSQPQLFQQVADPVIKHLPSEDTEGGEI